MRNSGINCDDIIKIDRKLLEKLEIPCTVILKDKGKLIEYFCDILWEKFSSKLMDKAYSSGIN